MRAAVWPVVRLRDAGAWFGGGTPSKVRSDYWTNGKVPWLSPKDMGTPVVAVTRDMITRRAVEESSTRLVPGPSIAVVVRSGILERTFPIAVVPFDTSLNQDMKALHPRADVDVRWVAWWLRSQERHILQTCRKRGTTVASIDTRAFLDLEMPLPQIEEQRRIVEILEDHLSRLDAASTLLSSAVARWEALWQTAAEGELTGRRVTGERNESPGLSEEGVDDGALPQLPFGWRWQRLRDVADVVGGVTKDAKRQTDPSLVEIPYLRVANVQRGFLDLANVTTIRVPRPTAEGLRLMAGDVLLNEGGDRDKLGRGWVWEGQIDGCIHQNHVFRARVRDSAIDPYLLSWAANTIGGRWCERNGRQSVNLASISLSRIRLMPVPVPPRMDQPAILGRLNALLEGGRKLRSNARAASTRAESLRRSLLYTAFSGRLTGARTDEEIVQELAGV
ncbi:MAG: restriction endonuclease subunit S [Actinomycetota bacterium]